MERAALYHFNKLKPSTIPMVQFHSHLSHEIDQYASTTATHLSILNQFLLTKQIIYPFLTTMWCHRYGCANQYRCVSDIYLLSCLALGFSGIIDKTVVSPVHGKDVVGCLNSRYKLMLKLEMEKLLNPELIRDDPFFKFMQVYENEEDQSVSLSK